MVTPCLRNLAATLLILGVACTPWWQPFTTAIPLKASDVLFLLALCACAVLLCVERRPAVPDRDSKAVLFALALLFVSIFAATLAGFLRYHLPMTRTGLILLSRLLMCMALFFAIRMLLRRSEDLGGHITLAFLSPVALYPAMLVPSFSRMMWAAKDHRFKGLTLNANTADLAFVVAFAVAYTLGMWAFSARRRIWGVALTGVSSTMVVLIVWTQSRDYLLSTFACALLGAALIAPSLHVRKRKVMVPTAVGYAAVVAAVLMLAPRAFSASFLARILPGGGPPPTLARTTFARPTPNAPPVAFAPQAELEIFGSIVGPRLRSLDTEPHIIEVRHFAPLVSANPLGLGVNYEAQFRVYIPSVGEHAGANTILDVPIYGGFGAVLSLGYFLFLVARNVRRRITMPADATTPYVIGAGLAIAGLWIAAVLLGSPIFDYQFWVLAALALA